jgi:rusticyanin
MERGTITRLIPAALAATGLAATVAIASCGPGTGMRHPAAPSGSQYNYYRSMMSRYRGGMVGGSPGSRMMGAGGYWWMTGGHGVPGWMHGERLPGYMMSGSRDPGKIMGRFWANAPGPRVSNAQAMRLGSELPAGAHVNRPAKTITFTTSNVKFAVLASPAGGPDETFRIAGLVNPKLVVPAGARVSIEVVNADADTAHGLVVAGRQGARSYMPMMTTRPAFAGSALWFLGDPTSAGMHVGTLMFTATAPGSYRYLCAVPGHALKGMTGMFIVSGHTT